MFEGKPTDDGRIMLWLKPRLSWYQRLERWLQKQLARVLWMLLGFVVGLVAGVLI